MGITVNIARSVVCNNMKEIIKEYHKLCREFGEKPFPIDKDDPMSSIQQHWSMVDEFTDKLVDILQCATSKAQR